MLGKLMKSEWFNLVFSVLLGMGIVAILRPVCQGGNCTVNKAPTPADWNNAVYSIGSKCWEFKSEVVECPKAAGAQAPIESFQSANRDSHLRLDGPE
jgi:hypothetical protein